GCWGIYRVLAVGTAQVSSIAACPLVSKACAACRVSGYRRTLWSIAQVQVCYHTACIGRISWGNTDRTAWLVLYQYGGRTGVYIAMDVCNGQYYRIIACISTSE